MLTRRELDGQPTADVAFDALGQVALEAGLTEEMAGDVIDGFALDAEGWRDRLACHVVRPVRWRESMEALAGLGATVFLEIGHGAMIAGVARRTVADVAVYGIAVPEAVDTLGGARS